MSDHSVDPLPMEGDWDVDLADAWLHQSEHHPWDDEIHHEVREIQHHVREEQLRDGPDRWLDA